MWEDFIYGDMPKDYRRNYAKDFFATIGKILCGIILAAIFGFIFVLFS